MEGALSLGALFVLGMVLSPQEDSLRLDELFWFLQSYRFHYHKKKRKKHNNILSPMYGTKYSNTIHPELQLVLLLACPLLQGRELYAGFYPSVGAFCFGTIWTAASPSSWWRNQATWQHFVSETRRQHFLWIWKKSTDLPRFCRVVRIHSAFLLVTSLYANLNVLTKVKVLLKRYQSFNLQYPRKKLSAIRNLYTCLAQDSWTWNARLQGIHDTGHFQRVASECPTSHFDKLASQGSLLRFLSCMDSL